MSVKRKLSKSNLATIGYIRDHGSSNGEAKKFMDLKYP